ncbi:MAG: hypothetical protein IT166_19155 [Bryobacterales bacterium]|nr:hypothetical protein [Bryobacterales bacterium]
MLAALLMVAALTDWAPARWSSNDPSSLSLLQGTPVNCLLMEQKLWSGPFVKKAAERNVAVLGLLHPGGDTAQSVRTAREQGLQGVVLEGDFAEPDADAARKSASSANLALVELPSRRDVRFGSGSPILGSYQGVFPGILPVDEKDKAHAMPSGGPWIDTNAGFLRYARALHKGEFWVAVKPPENQVLKVDRYLQAIGDAAMLGARWVVSLDGDFTRRLLAGDPKAVADWKKIGQYMRFYEDLKGYRDLPSHGKLAVLQDASSGALLSGGVLDMIAVKHTPVRPVPGSILSAATLDRASMAVNVDPESLTPAGKEVLKEFTRHGGTVLNGPPGWKMPSADGNRITMDKDDVAKLDEIWKEVNTMIDRRNLGVRLFNVSSMLSYLQAARDGKVAVLHLLNFSDYPVENVTAHVLGKFRRAWLLTPEGGKKALEPYEVEEGPATGLDIDLVHVAAAVVLEQ